MPSPARRPSPTRAAASPQSDSPERLVQAARDVLAEHGLAGFKVLEVAARANANVALINYHFGGRDGLLDEVVRRSGAEVAQARSARLDALLESAAGTAPDARDVLHCWIDPWIASLERPDNREVMLLLLHLMFAADVDRARKEHLLEGSVAVTTRFIDVLARCYPGADRSQMTWRMLCAVGSSYLVLGQHEPVGWSTLAAGAQRPKATEAARELVAFILGGFSAEPADAHAAASRKPGALSAATIARGRAATRRV